MAHRFTREQLDTLGLPLPQADTKPDTTTQPPETRQDIETPGPITPAMQRRLSIIKYRRENHPVVVPLRPETPAQREARLQEELIATAQARQQMEHRPIEPAPSLGATLQVRKRSDQYGHR